MDKAKTFIELCEERYSKKDVETIHKAIRFIQIHLGKEIKSSSKSVVEFNIEVGDILARSELSPEIVVAGLLYGIEKILSFEAVCKEFGDEIGGIVFGQLQLRIIRRNNQSIQAELVRKILLTGLDDMRIILVKLAVKLANMRIISALKESKQKEIAKDVLEIYSPLAMRLGLDYIKVNLEDLAFKTIYPRQYEEILNFFKESKNEREEFVEKFKRELKCLLESRVELLKIKGRDKQVKSIFEKIITRGIALKNQRDHYAIRIIVRSEEDCYGALGVLHENYIPVPGRLKDYINSPKLNGYQSIHTIIKIPNSQKEIEVQIRTEKMDEFAEEGTASHWKYKRIGADSSFEKKVGWIKALMESQRSSSDNEFIKNLKLDLFADKIYCYTPKGDAKELPKNSTILDFAYSVHQEIGEKTVGGRIDGKFVPLKEPLTNGCVVEILTNKNQRPRRDWLKFVVSSKARSKIKQGIKKYESIPVSGKKSILLKDSPDFDSLVKSEEFPNVQFSFAKCCYPLPKDRLLGVAKSHKNILVHKQDCRKLACDLKNAVPVFWKENFNRPLNLKILSGDRSGILSDLLNTISRIGFIVKKANAKLVGNGYVECDFAIIPKELDEVCLMIERVKKIRDVKKIFFE